MLPIPDWFWWIALVAIVIRSLLKGFFVSDP